jgi:HicA toxin of bacterial toxin-antitoxin,
MSQRLPAAKPREVIRALERAGFYVHHSAGSHRILKHPERPELRAAGIGIPSIRGIPDHRTQSANGNDKNEANFEGIPDRIPSQADPSWREFSRRNEPNLVSELFNAQRSAISQELLS